MRSDLFIRLMLAALGLHQLAVNATLSSSSNKLKMLKLFDFENYKQLYKKVYLSNIEEQVRRQLFTSRVCRTLIAAIKYRHRNANFYLAINHMSDMPRAELMHNARLRNRAEMPAGEQQVAQNNVTHMRENLKDVAETVDCQLVDETAGNKKMRDQLLTIAQSLRRRKRGTSTREPRELPLDKLVQVPHDSLDPYSGLTAETKAKIRERPPSNNPLYGGIEQMTRGLIDQQTTLEAVAIMPAHEALDPELHEAPVNFSLIFNDRDGERKLDKPDEVFLDLRAKSNCFFAPRNQGTCGACYAFAGITVAEWLHCKVTGELIAFSEQYLIDCGPAYSAGDLLGCTSGRIDRLASFFQNFGWELRANYPYRMRQEECPYPGGTDLRTVGYIRGELRKELQFKMNMWLEVLERYGPMTVNMNALGGPFQEYGGGVYDACAPKRPDHSVVLIGHGREDGQEYWLIRNSFSVGWGEAGHMKLSKRADCIWPHWGFSFGSEDGQEHTMTVTRNNKYNNQGPVRARYQGHLLSEGNSTSVPASSLANIAST